MNVGKGLEIEAQIQCDSARLDQMDATPLAACPDANVFHDPTRGGLTAGPNEFAETVSALGADFVIDHLSEVSIRLIELFGMK